MKAINIKMTTKSQLPTTESKIPSKQTTRTGTESQKWRSHGGYQQGGQRERMGERFRE